MSNRNDKKQGRLQTIPGGRQSGQPGPMTHTPTPKVGQQQQVPIDLSNATQAVCQDCGCTVFEQGVQIFKVSAIISPNGQEITVQKMVLSCIKCHTPVDEKDLVPGVTPVSV